MNANEPIDQFLEKLFNNKSWTSITEAIVNDLKASYVFCVGDLRLTFENKDAWNQLISECKSIKAPIRACIELGLNTETNQQDSDIGPSKRQRVSIFSKLEKCESTDPPKAFRRRLKSQLMKRDNKRCVISGVRIITEYSGRKDRALGGKSGIASHLVDRSLIVKTYGAEHGEKYSKPFDPIPASLMNIFKNDAYSPLSAVLAEEDWNNLIDARLICFKDKEIQYSDELKSGELDIWIPERPPNNLCVSVRKEWPPLEILVSASNEWPPLEVFTYHRLKAYNKWHFSQYKEYTEIVD